VPLKEKVYYPVKGKVVEGAFDDAPEDAIDCTAYEGKSLIDYLNSFAFKTVTRTGLAYIFRKPDPLAYALLSSAFDVSFVYIKDKFFSRGKIVAPKSYKVQGEASVSGDNVTKAKPKVHIETWQEDGSWRYPTDLKEKWEQLGKPRFLGIFPDYSSAPGFLPNETFADFKAKQAEASVSGDAITRAKPRIVVECWQADGSFKYPENLKEEWEKLGKPKFLGIFPDYSKIPGFLPQETFEQWQQKQVKEVEASTSGDQITKVKPKTQIETEDVPAEMQMWKDQVAQNLITHRILNNLYKLSTDRYKQPLLHGLMTKGRMMLVPGHFLSVVNQDDEITMENIFKVKFTFPLSACKIVNIQNSIGENKEAILIGLPTLVHTHSDITKHFSDSLAMGKYVRADANLPVLRYSEQTQSFLTTILSTKDVFAEDCLLKIKDANLGDFMIRSGLSYTAPTTKGDCGAPLIINEPSVLRKIAGIHVAGDATGTAWSESITQKDLTRAYKEFPATMQIDLDFDRQDMKFHNIPIKDEYTYDDLCFTPGPSFAIIGKCKDSIMEPCQTDLRPSIIHGIIQRPITKPAILRDPHINMKFKNLQKCAASVPYINQDYLDECYRAVATKWLANRKDEFRRILTDDEVIKGNEVSEYIASINRRSSPGYPWIKRRSAQKPGKTQWFGEDEYIISDEVMQVVNDRITYASQGVRMPTFWVDTLKDERRPIEKVDARKTRVFSNGPMDFNLAFRKYYLGFIAHLMENRIQNEVSIGTNVYSRDWERTARKLQSKGKRVFAGDFSSFDGSLNSMMMSMFAKLTNEFYDDGNDLIRYTLLEEVYNSLHLCDGLFYGMTHSQPSGNPATTPLNCFINSMGLRLCFIQCYDEYPGFFRNMMKKYGCQSRMELFEATVSIVSYGDDNVINVCDEISTFYNQNSVKNYFANIGFTYTDESKTLDGKMPDYKMLSEVSYLKRAFRKDEKKTIHDAPLDLSTILEMINWVRKDLDQIESTKINCETAIMELAMHDEQVFAHYEPLIRKTFYDKTGLQLSVQTYRQYWENRYQDYFI
jgi:hypothetical protein